jgi:NTE family protein
VTETRIANALTPTRKPDADQPKAGIGLALSGGGYRAMLFHVGSLWRLYQSGLLRDVDRISSVSGGSITAGVLALAWQRLMAVQQPSDSLYASAVVSPLRTLASQTIDVGSVLRGLLLRGSVGDRVAKALDDQLFHGATLQSLPAQAPRFVINATNIQSGALWRFSSPYMGDWRVGRMMNPTLPLAQAVAASAAFPPVLSPLEFSFDPSSFTPDEDSDLSRPEFTSQVLLADGGVYDNLGLETIWKNYRTVLVSDGGAKLAAERKPKRDWPRHAYRVLGIIDDQVRSLRKRQLIASYTAAADQKLRRAGAYWGIRTDIGNYGVTLPYSCPLTATRALAEVPTRLKAMDGRLQERLINWGYAVCDAALRAHVVPSLDPPASFPYPASGVG